MITDTDVKKLKKTFVTKDDLKEELKKFATKDDLSKTVQNLRNDIITFKDEILHEIVKLREDMVVVRGWGDRLEDHDQRIGKLEKVVLQ